MELKDIRTGSIINFTLKSGKGTASTGNIKGIVLRQRAVSGGEILSTNLVYGNGGSEGTTVQNTTKEQDVTTTNKQETTKASETTTKKPEQQRHLRQQLRKQRQVYILCGHRITFTIK